jgi:hypothetical protein
MSGALPPGFTLDEPSAAPSAALPPGFTLEEMPADGVPGPRREPTGRGEGRMPFLNRQIAETLGMPVDFVNSVLRMAGVPVSDQPFGGSASIEAGMARAGREAGVTMVPEIGATPQTPGEYAAAGVGSAVGMLNPTVLGARLAARVGGPLVSRVGRTIAGAPVAAPFTTAGTEVAAGAGGGAGRYIAEQNYPGNEPVAQLAELGGGLTGGVVAQAPSLLLRTPGVATVIDAAKSVLPSGARGRATERLSSLVEDPYAASRAAAAPTISDLTPAQRTGEANLLDLERAVAAENPAIARQLRERADAAQATLLAEARALGGRPEDTRAFLEDRVTRLTTALNTRVEQAQTEARRRIAALEPGAPAADASRIAREEFDKAYKAARDQERILWNSIPSDVRIDTAPLFERFAALVQETPRTQRHNIPDYARRFLGREAPDEQTDAVLSQLNTLYPGAFPQPPQASQRLGATATPAELQGLRSELLDIERTARDAGRRNEARIAGRIADDVLDALNSLPETAGPYAVAREHSKNVNEVFRGGEAAVLSRTTGGSEPRVAPELTLERLLGSGGPRADVAARDLLVATGNSPETRTAIENYLTQSFRNTAVSGEGRLKPESATNWMRRNAALLDRFPEVRNQLAEAMTAQGRAETLTARQAGVERGLLRRDDSRVERLLDQRPESAVARFLNAAPGKEVDRVFSADDPAALAASLRRSVDRDQTGQALSGLRGAFIDNLFGRARQTTPDGPVFNGSAIMDALNDPKQVAALGAVFDAPALQRLRQIGTELTALERARSASARGGVIEDIPSKALDLVSRFVAARTVSGLAESAIATGAVRSFLAKMTTDRAQRLLSDAITNPELFSTLMSPISTPKQQDMVMRRLQGFLAGSAGRAVTGEEEDRQPAPNAMAPAGASGNVNAMAR